MLKFILPILFLLGAVFAAPVPNGTTHTITVTVDTGAETSSNYYHQIDLTDYLSISDIDAIIDSSTDITVCPIGDSTKYPKWAIYDSGRTCVIDIDAPISSTGKTQFRICLGVDINVVNSASVYSNNNIDNHWGFTLRPGSTITDMAGSNDGTSGGTDTITSVFDLGENFSAANEYVLLGQISALQSVNKFTIQFIANFSDMTTGQRMFFKVAGSLNSFYIYIQNSAVEFSLNNGTVFSANVGISGYQSTGENKLWTIVYDGTQSTNADKFKFYINNDEMSMVYTGTCPSTTGTMAINAYMGFTSLSMINCTFDEFSIYSTNVNADWISNRYSTLFDSVFYTLGNIRNVSITTESVGPFNRKTFRVKAYRSAAFRE